MTASATIPSSTTSPRGGRPPRHVWVVMADSNVLLPSDYLHRLFATWRADTGLVSSPAIGCRPDGLWAELECAFLNTYQARWQCFADSLGIGFAQGKTMMYRRELVEHAGGIRALAAEPAEDAASTKLVRGMGLRVRVVDRPIRAAARPAHRRRGLAPAGALGAAAARHLHALFPARAHGRRSGAADSVRVAWPPRTICRSPRRSPLSPRLVRPRGHPLCRRGLACVLEVAAGLAAARPPRSRSVGGELDGERARLAREHHAHRRPQVRGMRVATLLQGNCPRAQAGRFTIRLFRLLLHARPSRTGHPRRSCRCRKAFRTHVPGGN